MRTSKLERRSHSYPRCRRMKSRALSVQPLEQRLLLSVVSELEQDGYAVNNNLVSAQPIALSSFTLPQPPNVSVAYPTATVMGRGGGISLFSYGDVDFYSFTGGPGRLVRAAAS